MPTGTSGYLKPKAQRIKELDKATGVAPAQPKAAPANPVDRMAEDMNRQYENAKGVTDYIRNIFDD